MDIWGCGIQERLPGTPEYGHGLQPAMGPTWPMSDLESLQGNLCILFCSLCYFLFFKTCLPSIFEWRLAYWRGEGRIAREYPGTSNWVLSRRQRISTGELSTVGRRMFWDTRSTRQKHRGTLLASTGSFFGPVYVTSCSWACRDPVQQECHHRGQTRQEQTCTGHPVPRAACSEPDG